MEKLLISACLLGENCKYNGGNNYLPLVELLKERYELIAVCPESMGGLTSPRLPSERVGEKVVSKAGEDVTAAFEKGAAQTLEIALTQDVKKALFKERSPSCGCGEIYDGTFSGTLKKGNGAAAEKLLAAGVSIWGESKAAQLLEEEKAP